MWYPNKFITSNDKKRNSTNSKTTYNQLEEAKKNLYNNNCAHPLDDNGNSPTAEELKKEIIELQKQLQDKSSTSSQDKQDEKEENKEDEDYSDIEKKIKEIEKQANANRQSDLSDYENRNNYSYYSGKRW